MMTEFHCALIHGILKELDLSHSCPLEIARVTTDTWCSLDFDGVHVQWYKTPCRGTKGPVMDSEQWKEWYEKCVRHIRKNNLWV